MSTPATTSATASQAGISHVDHVAIRVPDYDATLRFYTDKLGFELVKEWTLGDAAPGVRLAYLRLGAFMIEVIGDARPAPVPESSDIASHLSRSGYIHLCLRVTDVERTLAQLRERGVEVFAEPFVIEPIGQRLAMVKDNSGNVIELAQDIPS